MRDATYVLDEILDNETELPILEHTTDTAGYTEIVFALFDLLGLQFSPRIRDLGDQRLYRLSRDRTYPNLGPRLKGRVRSDLIVRRWDDTVNSSCRARTSPGAALNVQRFAPLAARVTRTESRMPSPFGERIVALAPAEVRTGATVSIVIP